MLNFALGVAWICSTLLVALGMAKAVAEGHLNDCERLGKFRYGETVVECKVVKP